MSPKPDLETWCTEGCKGFHSKPIEMPTKMPIELTGLAHRNRSDLCDLRLRCPSRTPEIARFLRQEKAMLHCDLRVRWKVASDLRFRAAISESKTPSFCGISGDLAPSTRKSLAIAIVRFWCAKELRENQTCTGGRCLPTSAWWPLETPLARFRVRNAVCEFAFRVCDSVWSYVMVLSCLQFVPAFVSS